MLDVKTPLIKCVRVSRKIDIVNFIGQAGVWIKVNSDGSASNITTNSAPTVAKLCIGTHTDNAYESRDVDVGKITTMETIGARCDVDSIGFNGTNFPSGSYLTIDVSAGNEGKLKIANSGDTIFAVTEGYNSETGVLTFTLNDQTIAP